MVYTIQQLATLASVSVRTLHYYDEIGLLSPAFTKSNGYRYYTKTELVRLQQILFFKELEFSLEDIKKIMLSKTYDSKKALLDQRHMFTLKKKRIETLLKTVDKTIKSMNDKKEMKDEELYGGLTKEEMESYEAEAKERWGNTDAWKQSKERTKHWTLADKKRIAEENDICMKKLASLASKGPEDREVQVMIGQHYNSLRTYYEPSFEMYRGLAEMFVADERFKKNLSKYHPRMAEFMREAMIYFVEHQV